MKRARNRKEKTQATSSTTSTRKVGGAIVENDETVEPVSDLTYEGSNEPAIVTVGGSITRNLGDFNSCRVEVRLSMPCDRDGIDTAYEQVSEWVDSKLSEELNAATGEGNTNG